MTRDSGSTEKQNIPNMEPGVVPRSGWPTTSGRLQLGHAVILTCMCTRYFSLHQYSENLSPKCILFFIIPAGCINARL